MPVDPAQAQAAQARGVAGAAQAVEEQGHEGEAAEHVQGLTVAELDEYEALLNQETIDIFQIVNGQQEPPPELKGSQILARLQAYAAAAPFGKASVRGYEAMKDKTNLI